MWNTEKKHLGVLKAKSRNKIEFVYNGQIEIDVKSITSLCSCTEVTWNKSTNTMSIIYVPKPVPTHLKRDLNMDHYNDLKEVKFNATIDNKEQQISLAILAQVFD